MFAVAYVPIGIESPSLKACNACITSINGRSEKIRALPMASLAMCTHFPVLVGEAKRLILRDRGSGIRQKINSIRAAVEQRGVTALPLDIQDSRRSYADKVGLLSKHPGDEIFVANR